MELDEFVRKSLFQIVKGVSEAQDAVNEDQELGNTTASICHKSAGEDALRSTVTFDVAVTVTGKADAGFKLAVFGVGAGGKVESQDSTVSRVQFSVPVYFPQQE